MELQITTKYNEMKFRFKTMLSALMGGLMLAASPSAEATITFTGGVADLVFFYEAADDRFDVVFRSKGAQVSGNDTPYPGFTGIVAGDRDLGNDYSFTNLQVNVSSSPLSMVNGIGYYITSATGSSYADSAQPDFGIRTRLREDEVALGDPTGSTSAIQFANMLMTLNWAASSKPVGAQFVMYRDGIPTTEFPDGRRINFETVEDDFSHLWPSSGHSHWHFGFSELGDYSLVFDLQGIGGTHGDSGDTTFTMDFNIIPEPSTALLSLMVISAIGLRRRRA